jgi:hypothetical protein
VPGPGHEGPCATPWALRVVDGESLGRERERMRAEIAETQDTVGSWQELPGCLAARR